MNDPRLNDEQLDYIIDQHKRAYDGAVIVAHVSLLARQHTDLIEHVKVLQEDIRSRDTALRRAWIVMGLLKSRGKADDLPDNLLSAIDQFEWAMADVDGVEG